MSYIRITAEQAEVVDSHRNPECKHPAAVGAREYIFLDCKRCGVNFCDGTLRLIQRFTEADDSRDGVQRPATLAFDD